jgi:protein-S-isoprenylcysteine O-methyltransferase Ste14
MPFAVNVVGLQDERDHALVDAGIYNVVRHPMYSGSPLVLLGLCLWLGSTAAVVCAALPLGLLIVRVQLEERFLQLELPGYREYMKRVPCRLLPRIW